MLSAGVVRTILIQQYHGAPLKGRQGVEHRLTINDFLCFVQFQWFFQISE